jgi:hypothetical protein
LVSAPVNRYFKDGKTRAALTESQAICALYNENNCLKVPGFRKTAVEVVKISDMENF